jgi:hypothetical protein
MENCAKYFLIREIGVSERNILRMNFCNFQQHGARMKRRIIQEVIGVICDVKTENNQNYFEMVDDGFDRKVIKITGL